jgi:hypothetical protein
VFQFVELLALAPLPERLASGHSGAERASLVDRN